jgi:ubiquinone/menaquinone biosynthesis C-methylase UbiE
MTKQNVDYNSIAQTYDSRYEVSPLEGISFALKNLIEKNKPENILEVGCGTAHWLELIANEFKYELSLNGIDLYKEMIKIGKRKSFSANLICAHGEQLPIQTRKFDLVFIVNAVHFLKDTNSFIKQVYSILNPGGILCVIGFDPRDDFTEWYLYEHFDGTFETDLNRYQPFEELESLMRKTGFENIETKSVERILYKIPNENVMDDHFLKKENASQLALLSDEEYERGIEKLKRTVEKNSEMDERKYFIQKLIFKMITGTK